MKDLLNTTDLVEVHEKLNRFAEHHKKIGLKKSYELIKSIWEETKYIPKDASPSAKKYDEGFDAAFTLILNKLPEKFH